MNVIIPPGHPMTASNWACASCTTTGTTDRAAIAHVRETAHCVAMPPRRRGGPRDFESVMASRYVLTDKALDYLAERDHARKGAK